MNDLPFRCRVCGLTFGTPEVIRGHYKEEHMPHIKGPQKKELRCSYPKPKDHDCNKVCREHNHECRETCKGLGALKRHALKHLPKETVEVRGYQGVIQVMI